MVSGRPPGQLDRSEIKPRLCPLVEPGHAWGFVRHRLLRILLRASVGKMRGDPGTVIPVARKETLSFGAWTPPNAVRLRGTGHWTPAVGHRPQNAGRVTPPRLMFELRLSTNP